PTTVYASACSGIYKSEDKGSGFHKVQGMPFSARRTRVLMQDPAERNTVYAGTTEGLWKTTDGGKTFKRVTSPNVIVNDVLIDPRNPSRVLIATDRSGVLMSLDGASTFTASNRGFAHRQITSLIIDRNNSQTLYASAINDKEFGGVFMSRDAGLTWSQLNAGLDERDVFALRQYDDGALIAGTNQGIFSLANPSSRSAAWSPRNVLMMEKQASKPVRSNGKTKFVPTTTLTRGQLSARVSAIHFSSTKW